VNSAAPGGRHLFLVRSSLQFLLASTMAEDQRQRDGATSRLLFLPDVLDPALFERVAADWTDAPFDRILTIEPRRLPGDTAAHRPGSAIRRELRAALADAEPTSVTVFNDREEPGQLLLIEAARRFPQALRRCAEDGAQAYTGFTYRAHGPLTRLRQRLRLGREWADVRVLGTHPLVQEFAAMYPALLRPELRGPKARALPADALSSEPLQRFARRLCELAGFDAATVPAGAAVLTISSSNYSQRNPDYLARVRACVQALHAQGVPVCVKYHPRESAPALLGEAPGVRLEIPRTIPVECLWLQLRERALSVVGARSTSLLTARLLLPQARILALDHASASGDHWDATLLQALRIEAAP
jgi:hypothetical protein